MPGEVKALLAAALWATAGIVFAFNMRRLGPVTLNLIRCLAGLLFVCLLAALIGTHELRHVSAPTVAAMIGSGILAIALGDTLFFAVLPTLGASLAVPLSGSVYPVLTFFIAVLWLDETLTWMVVFGTALILVGIFLLVWRAEAAPPLPESEGETVDQRIAPSKAVALLMVASIFYTASTVWLRAGSGDIGAVPANLLRASAASLFLLMALGARHAAEPQRPTFWAVAWLAAAGILAVGVGGLLYIQAVQEAGAGRTAVLTSTMPLFNLPLAVLFLKERVTPQVVIGTVTCVLGIWLVI